MVLNNWDNSYCDDKKVISLIRGADKLISLYGRWPTFSDSEILECNLSRGNILECMRANNWSNKIDTSMSVAIYLFDERYADSDVKRNPVITQLLFSDIHELRMDGFNHQNPICGVGIHRVHSDQLGVDAFKVDWGGAAIQHDVSLLCGIIEVVSVVPKK